MGEAMDVEGEHRVTATVARPPATRLAFLDGLRGIAIILMVVNHTSRWWVDSSMGWARYYLVYGSVILPAPIFLFLAGFCLPISYHRRLTAQRLGTAGASGPEGWRVLLTQFGRRGAVIIGAGLLLNVVVFPDEPWWSGGVLQTIGFSIIVVAACIPLMTSVAARVAILVLGVALYVAFALSYPALTLWVAAHVEPARVIFYDFPPWPWICPALIGLVLGWTWLEVRQRGEGAEMRYFTRATWLGVASLAGYAAWEAVWPTTPRFGFPRDLVLNHHWTPRGVTNLIIIGGVALLLAGIYYVMEVRAVSIPWLVTLGQTALVLYFVHQVIVYTIVNQWLGRRFNNWWLYVPMNLLLLVLLVYLGRAWLVLKAAAPEWLRSYLP